MDDSASEAVVKEFTERTLFLPAHKGVAPGEIDFKTDDPNVKASLDVFVKATGQVLIPRTLPLCRRGNGRRPTARWSPAPAK